MVTNIISAVGRRKTAIATVRMEKAEKSSVMVNGKAPRAYFETEERAHIALEALATAGSAEHYAVVEKTVDGMIPRNKLRTPRMKNLIVKA